MYLNDHIYFSLVESQLAEGLSVDLILRGTSMLCALHEGDTITLEPLNVPPVVGDVVLFRYCGRDILHRVIDIAPDGNLTMRGDNVASCEHCHPSEVLARLTMVNGISTDSDTWRRMCRRSLARGWVKRQALRWLGRDGRRRLAPWYFVLLAILMWAPLAGFGVPLNNYVLGIRADHLLHASVYLPCALMLADLCRRRWGIIWVVSLAVGITTEVVQHLLPYRGFDINDMVANAIGITFGWLITYYFLQFKKKT